MPKLTKKQNSKNFSAYISVWSSIIGNILLFILKLWAGLTTASVAVIADAWHTLSDSISSIIVLIGVKISEKKPTRKFHFGFGRADTIASGILSVLLFIIAIEILIKGAGKLIQYQNSDYSTIVYVAMGLTIIFKEIMARISIWGAKKSLTANAWHHRSDAISSIVILIGVFLNRFFWWIDGVLAIVVALIIGYTAFEILKDIFISVIDESHDEQFKQKLRNTVNEVAKMEIYPHHIHLHSY